MKKFLLIAFTLICLQTIGFSQEKQKTKATKTERVTRKQSSNTAQKVTVPSTTATTKTKKDGTPDMRYKSNKGAVKSTTTVHVKKNGTPDKRYKENKKKG